MDPERYVPPVEGASLSLVPTHRVRLAHLPTPLQPWPTAACPGGRDLWILRDDLTGVTLSGNKVRKLEFLLAEALQRGCDTVLTCGGIQSNHARATAIAAARLGMSAHLFLRTPTPDRDPGHTGNLLLNRTVGAQHHLITPEQYRDRDNIMAASADQLREQGAHPAVIPEGGSNALGCWGYINAVFEWARHHDLLHRDISDLVVALGSGGTVAGIAAGLHLLGSTIRVHAVNVCDDAETFYTRIQDLFDELGLPLQARQAIHIHDGYVGLGYGESRDEELGLLQQVARETGIFLDPVYTGKAFYGMTSELASHPTRFQADRILFVHTGGLFGLYAVADRLTAGPG